MEKAILIALKCIENEATGCWEYQGAKLTGGYGAFTYGGVTRPASRVMLEEVLGHPLVGMACHHCDNPSCCNPGHLYDGTAKTNAGDMIMRDRGKGQFRPAYDHPNAKLKPEDVAVIRDTPNTYGSGRMLAEKYGVSASTISMIRSGQIYVTSKVEFPADIEAGPTMGDMAKVKLI